MKQKRTGLLALALCAALLLAACGRIAVEDESSGGSSSGVVAETQGSESGAKPENTPDAEQENTADASASQTTPEGDDSKETNASGTAPTETEPTGTGSAGTAPAESDPTAQTWTPTVTVSETVQTTRTDESGETVLLDFSYNTVTVSIPGNEAAAAAIQADLDAQLNKLMATADELVQTRTEDEFYDGEYALIGVYTLTRADSGAISFRYKLTEYMGGAHESSEISGVSYDTATGARLTLATLGEGVREAATEPCQLLTQTVADNNEGFFFDGYLEGVESSVVTDDTFWLTADGLVFIDNEYVLQSYAAGTLEYLVPYSALADVLNEAYALSGTEGAQASVTLADGTVYTLE